MLLTKRLLSMFMCLVLLVSLFPVSVLAEEGEEIPVHEHDYKAVVTEPTCTGEASHNHTQRR